MSPILLGLLGFGLFGAGHSQVRRFERSATADLASRLHGEDKRVEIRAKVGPEALFGQVHAIDISAQRFEVPGLPFLTEPQYSQRGHIGALRVDLRNFSLAGLPVRRLCTEIPDCRFDFAYASRHGKIRLTRSGQGWGEVDVDAAALEKFAARKFPGLREIRITIERDQIAVDASASLGFVSGKLAIFGRLRPVDGTRLTLEFPRILINGEPARPEIKAVLLRLISTVIDLDRDLHLMGALHVERLRLRDGILHAEGTAKIPIDPDRIPKLPPATPALTPVSWSPPPPSMLFRR